MPQFADPSLAHHFAGQSKSMIAPLPRAHLHDAAGLGHDLAHQLAFVDGERQRLFAVHVLAGPTSVDDHPRVPMVGRADHDHVQVRAVEQLAIVFVQFGFAAELLASLFGDLTIDVGDRYHVALGLGLLGDDRSLIAHADRTDTEAIVLRPRASAVFGIGREDVRIGHGGRACSAGSLQKTAA